MKVRGVLCLCLTVFAFSCGSDGDRPKKVEPCGNGMVDFEEKCDTGIESGPGACPTECPSNDPCAPMELQNEFTCDAECVVLEVACGESDSCCPSGCTPDDDSDCTAADLCGNGVVDPGETCDPAAPDGCGCEQPDDACIEVTTSGSSRTCDFECTFSQIEACINGDGCCPSGCSGINDSDCPAECGNGIVEASEVCDGDCPTSCDDGDACTMDTLFGSAASCDSECSFDPVTSCTGGDGCCPSGCDANSDSDCDPLCGNGVIEAGEECDGNCPTSCDDGMACTTDLLVGDPNQCTATCEWQPISACIDADGCCPNGCTTANDSDCGAVCGNGTIEGAETCDGNCPSACSDGIACTTDIRTGDASTCNVVCTFDPITACVSGDGCCPNGCTTLNDNDCSATCGNAVIEGNETCDGNCPTFCSDGDACTDDVLTGSAANCDAGCAFNPITACLDGDGCCPNGCTFVNDNDCACIPDTCASLGLTCGVLADDGCGGGGEICGTCAAGDTCVDNLCEDNLDVGQDCTSDADCDGGAGACFDEASTAWTGGYCTRTCSFDAECGAPNHCNPFEGHCWQTCESDLDCSADDACYDYDGDGRTECAPAGTGSGDVGDPCVRYSDCGGGADGWCSPEADSQFLGGVCSVFCSVDSDCPAGSHCWAGVACMPDCASDLECRGNGYACFDEDGDAQTECFRFGNGAGVTGAACTGLWDCDGGEFAWCLQAESGYPGGYCSTLCAAGEGTCANGAVCGSDGVTDDVCFDACQNTNQCRPNYTCTDIGAANNACVP